MVQIVGKYEHEKNEGFEEYLKTVGGADQVKTSGLFAQSKPTLQIQQTGDEWVITVTNEGKNAASTFKLGVPYDETMPNGVVMKVIVFYFI